MPVITAEQAKKTDASALFGELSSTIKGLTQEEAKKRIEEYGPNSIIVKKENVFLKFLGYFWGPIPWMIEIAALLSLVNQDWADVAIIGFLLVFNAAVGFVQEYQAGNAVESLKKSLAQKCRVLRDGSWLVLDASELVPGDVIRLRLGDIVPADVKLCDGQWLSVDQAALTGESLPVTKRVGDTAYSGSIIKQGEMVALVTATGSHTYFGKTTQLVASVKNVSHFQKAVLQIGDFLIYLSLSLVFILMVVQLERGDSFAELLQFALILVVASIPAAMPAVLSVTMAKGALMLAKMKAIVTKLESIEEMAGLDILCSDKTGTLTQNKLELIDPVVFDSTNPDDLIFYAALASKSENQDAIDLTVIHGVKNPERLTQYKQENFVPFDPVGKRTEATIVGPDAQTFQVTKGAPQVILKMSAIDPGLKAKVEESVEALGSKGYRTLGVAIKQADSWTFLGLLPMADPLREDSASTIQEAREHGISVKMITGDNLAIGREIAGQLNLGDNIVVADQIGLLSQTDVDAPLQDPEELEKVNAFCQVFPEHKYTIVKALQQQDHIVGMTGDGVNDAPALKQADVGIAVSDATDAARSAASLVLTAPGLSVIVSAIEEARRIFERMNSYAIYRITETLRIMFFIVLSILVYNFYPISAVMIILLAALNDIPIMTIAYDNTWTDPKPVKWQMRRVLTVATMLGIVGVIETFLVLIIAKSWMGIGLAELQTLIFLKLVVAGHLTLFVARTRKAFFSRPYPSPILLTAIVATQVFAAMLAGFGWFVHPITWEYIGMIWIYCLFWMCIEDITKLLIYRRFDMKTPPHQQFLSTVKEPLQR